MAAISSISNGEAMSSVRTKLNSVITEINILDPVDWTDYSATSTIVGWSSFTTKQIRYKIVGKQIFVYFYLAGTSNSVNVTFTLPNNSINLQRTFSSCVNNGVAAGACITVASNASNIIEIGANSTTTSNFTASGTKSCLGQFFIEIA